MVLTTDSSAILNSLNTSYFILSKPGVKINSFGKTEMAETSGGITPEDPSYEEIDIGTLVNNTVSEVTAELKTITLKVSDNAYELMNGLTGCIHAELLNDAGVLLGTAATGEPDSSKEFKIQPFTMYPSLSVGNYTLVVWSASNDSSKVIVQKTFTISVVY